MAFTDRAAQWIHQQVTELGYRWVPEAQTHYFARPEGSEGQMGGLVMRWAEVGEDERLEELAVPDISGLSLAQKSDLVAQLTRDGVGGFGAPGPAAPSDAEVGSVLSPGQRFTDGERVRDVVEDLGEWVRVRDPESGWSGRMKRSTLDGWEPVNAPLNTFDEAEAKRRMKEGLS